MANRVKTSVYIDRQESIKNINNTLENLKLNNINIGFNTTNLNDLNKTINNVFDNLSTNFISLFCKSKKFINNIIIIQHKINTSTY